MKKIQRQNKILETAIFPKLSDSESSSSDDDFMTEAQLKISEIIVNNHKHM
jgi:hypothetical protein